MVDAEGLARFFNKRHIHVREARPCSFVVFVDDKDAALKLWESVPESETTTLFFVETQKVVQKKSLWRKFCGRWTSP